MKIYRMQHDVRIQATINGESIGEDIVIPEKVLLAAADAIREQNEAKWPKEGDEAYVSCNDGDISKIVFGVVPSYHREILTQGNLYRTKEEAEHERDRRALIKELCDYRSELGCTMPEDGDNCGVIVYALYGRPEWGARRVAWPYYAVMYDLGLSGYNTEDQVAKALEKFKDRLYLLLPYKASE